jgi:hypothetical protein
MKLASSLLALVISSYVPFGQSVLDLSMDVYTSCVRAACELRASIIESLPKREDGRQNSASVVINMGWGPHTSNYSRGGSRSPHPSKYK